MIDRCKEYTFGFALNLLLDLFYIYFLNLEFHMPITWSNVGSEYNLGRQRVTPFLS